MKISKQQILDLIEAVNYIQNGKTTICIIRLVNGYEIIGTSSVVDKGEFDEQIGKDIAKEDAINQIWALEGYRLQWEFYNQKSK